MISEKMTELGKKRSVIRETFEYGRKRAQEIGKENVFDFSLGNPSVPAPHRVEEAIKELLTNIDSAILHGYTSAPGDPTVLKAVADNLNKRFQTGITPEYIYMTTGAAASLCIALKAIVVPGDEIIAVAPFFPEYRVFVETTGAALVVAKPNPDNLQIDVKNLEAAITKNTKALILNSPNNPSGVVYTEDIIKKVTALLEEKEKEYGHPIYIISDEPYRELVYGGIKVPFLMHYYKNVMVSYSFSKSLSLPGERIGYLAVSPEAEGARDLYAAVCGAGRALGYVCAPSLFQRVAAKCLDLTSDISIYDRNRKILYDSLTSYGYACINPDGAFYLFIKSPEPDASAFCMRARKYELLLVPGDDFGCQGYVRIAYCVQTEQIERALPAFKKLADEYKA